MSISTIRFYHSGRECSTMKMNHFGRLPPVPTMLRDKPHAYGMQMHFRSSSKAKQKQSSEQTSSKPAAKHMQCKRSVRYVRPHLRMCPILPRGRTYLTDEGGQLLSHLTDPLILPRRRRRDERRAAQARAPGVRQRAAEEGCLKAETLFDREASHPPTDVRRTARQRRAGRIRVQYSFY